jgi:hypothetical protein
MEMQRSDVCICLKCNFGRMETETINDLSYVALCLEIAILQVISCELLTLPPNNSRQFTGDNFFSLP